MYTPQSNFSSKDTLAIVVDDRTTTILHHPPTVKSSKPGHGLRKPLRDERIKKERKREREEGEGGG